MSGAMLEVLLAYRHVNNFPVIERSSEYIELSAAHGKCPGSIYLWRHY